MPKTGGGVVVVVVVGGGTRLFCSVIGFIFFHWISSFSLIPSFFVFCLTAIAWTFLSERMDADTVLFLLKISNSSYLFLLTVWAAAHWAFSGFEFHCKFPTYASLVKASDF